VIGGVPGGTAGGVLGGILGGHGLVPPPPPPPKPLVKRGPLRVGGRIQPPRLIHQVPPEYPILAKETHTAGKVVIDCVIDEHGNVVQMKVVSGQPLLIQAAFDAVKQWKYEPTRLNGTPVSVEMSVVIHFSLNS
jgi:protein TonB